MKNSIIFALFCLSLLIFGCGDGGKSGKTAENGNDSGRETGSLYGECYPNETCNKGLECDVENNICVKETEKSEEPSNSDTEPEDSEDKTDKDSENPEDDNSTTDPTSDNDADTQDPENPVPDDGDSTDDDNVDNNCTTGKYKCSNSQSLYCNDGFWTNNEYCEYGCDSSTGKCKSEECTDEEYECKEGTSYSYSRYCNNGHWNSKSCEGGCDSSTGKCKEVCYKIGDYVWSSLSQDWISYEKAEEYCRDLNDCGYNDWRLPTISELRTLLQNCSAAETGGECNVTDTCLSSTSECYNQEFCHSCAWHTDGRYSKLGDTCWMTSSSHYDDDSRWGVYFGYGGVYAMASAAGCARCVRKVNME